MSDKPSSTQVETNQKKQQQSKATSKLFFEKLPLPYQSLDMQGDILEVNQRWLDLLGYKRQEVIGASFADFLHPDDVESFQPKFSTLTRIGNASKVEFQLVKKKGASLCVSLEGTIEHNTTDSSSQAHCLLVDITDYKRQENIRRNARNVWARTFDTINDIVTIQDTSLTIVKANKAAHTFFQVNDGQLQGKYCYEIFTGKLEPCPNCPLLVTLKNGSGHSAVISHEKLGKVFEVSSSLIPADNGVEEYLVHVARDITADLEKEKILKESEEKFLLAFNSSPDAININRLEDGLYIDVNSAFSDLTGFTEDDIQGKTSLDINIWDNPKDRQRLVQVLQEKGYCENLEAKFRRKDGSTTTALMSARVISLNNVPHIISITRDIGKLRKIEREIVEQKLLFETMFNAIDDGVVITDTKRRIILANKGMEKTFGYLPKELQGRTTERLYADPARYQTTGSSLYSKEAKHEDQVYVTEYKHKSGKEFPGETFGAKLFDKNNKWIGNLGIMRDISLRHKAEVERDRLIAAIEQTRDAIVITDSEANIKYVNPAFEAVTGCTRDEVLDQNPRILKSGEHDQQFYQGMWQTLNRGQTFKGRLVNRHKEGSLFTEEATISPIFDHEGQIVNFVGVKRDISEQILLESQLQQAQKMEAVGRLTGGVAHDFNNILSVIIGYTEMALEEVDPSQRIHGDLEKIQDAAERSADIVRQLLAFSRKQTISPKVIDLNTAVKGILKILHRLIGEDIDLSWIPEPEALLIKIDPAQIDQILANLCVNAKDAIEGGGKITIETTMASFDEDYCANHIGFSPGEFVQLSISDNGCGMDKKTQNHIFEPFFSTKELGHGTGLGLSTVYGIVKQNNGFINVYSELDRGTTFKIYFPLCTEGPPVPSTIVTAKSSKSQGETVLLVEDEPALLTMAQQMLELLGYIVLAADKPSGALKIAEEHPGKIDLVFTDVILPEMTGKEMASLIQPLHPNSRVLFMSGYTANVIAHNGILDEGIQFIQKPYSINELNQKIRDVLNLPALHTEGNPG